MKLADAAIEEFNREGYLFLPDLFTRDEATLLRNAADEVYALRREEVWREKSGAPRTEPPRVYRRLQLLRGLENEQSKSVFPRGQGAGSAYSVRASE